MQLIADSGSSKTVWHLAQKGNTISVFNTLGINPFFQTSLEIKDSIINQFPNELLSQITKIYFYGAGCANEEKNNIVKLGLQSIFQNADLFIGSDLLGAARSLCRNKPGIACILGTGSNSCFFDGHEIKHNISPLGFILGDEGSGAVLGKQLVADILKKQLPTNIIEAFYNNYELTSTEIVNSVYRLAFPNRFLAKFAHFIADNIQETAIEQLVINGFDAFIRRNLLQYTQINYLPIYFTGSIAYYFRKQLNLALSKHQLCATNICQNPMEGLLAFHA